MNKNIYNGLFFYNIKLSEIMYIFLKKQNNQNIIILKKENIKNAS
mgnify:CR=1 FL=1